MDNDRLTDLKRRWAAAVDCDDPDSLDDWPVELLMAAEASLKQLRADYALLLKRYHRRAEIIDELGKTQGAMAPEHFGGYRGD